jgi:outer membrane receptor for ferrienterochelin and colicins
MRFGVAVVFMLGYLCCFSQQAGTLSGVITNELSGEPIPFATVFLPEINKGTVTDDFGSYSISNLSPGKYKVVFSFVGYKNEEKQIEISADEITKLDVSLKENLCLLCDDPVIVTATLSEVSKKESPVVVEVYSPSFLKKNPTPALFEALQTVNGVRPQINCSVCNTGDIHINGMEGPYTMVMIDGMPIVSGLSTVYGLNGIPNSLIERMEIVKGPGSTLYGSEAVGGIVNVITKSSLTAPKFSFDYFGSDWLEHNLDLGYSAKWKKASTLIGVNYFNYSNPVDHNGDNFTDLTLQNRLSVFNKWNFRLKKEKSFSMATRYVYEDRWGGEMQWQPEFRGKDSVYGESIYTRRFEIFGNWQMPFKENINLQYSFSRHDQNSYYGITNYDALQQIGFLQMTWNKKINLHQFLTGISSRYNWYDDNTAATQTGDTSLLTNTPASYFLPGIFVQDEFIITENQKLLTGIRFDYHSRHGAIWSPRINYKLSWNSNLNILRIGAGNGFRVVNLFTEDHAATTGARDVIITEELKPEQSYNVNANYLHTFSVKNGYINFDISAFYTYFTNKIIPDYTTNDNQIIYSNLNGFAEIKGVSLNLEGVISDKWRIIIGTTMMDVFQMNDGVKSRPLLTEKISGTFTITYKIPRIGLSFDYTGNLTGPMLLPVLENDFRSPESPFYSIQNFQLTKSFKGSMELYAGVKNLLNFTPPANSIMRAFDPFDKYVNDPVNNPNHYTFDPSYVFASFQGIRAFFGFRYNLK